MDVGRLRALSPCRRSIMTRQTPLTSPLRRRSVRRLPRSARPLPLEALEARTLPSFVAPPAYLAGSGPVAVAGGDFNGDGRADLAVANNISAGTVSVVLNGGGTFLAA